MIRAVPAAAAAQTDEGEMFAGRFSENTPASEGQPAAPVGVQTVRNRLKRRTPHGPSLREELSELVKEDPDTAVNVLRAWIGNSGNRKLGRRFIPRRIKRRRGKQRHGAANPTIGSDGGA